jgi:gallate decarboxylase subunit D
MQKVVFGSAPLQVEIRGQWVGKDLVVTIGGGTKAHVGAVAVAQPRPSLRGDGRISASASVITLLGHKEDELARWAALHLASQLNTTVAVTAGVHLDQATPEQIAAIDAKIKQDVQVLAQQALTEMPQI